LKRESGILKFQDESECHDDNIRIFTWSGLSGNLGKTPLRLIEILAMYFDTSLKTSRRDCSPVRTRKSHGTQWGVSLRFSSCEEYDNYGKKQDPPVQGSSVHPTEFTSLKELFKRL
jgi:hypothetical protein